MNIFDRFQNYCCPVCEPDGIAKGFTTWFRVRPESAQGLHNVGPGVKRRYEEAIRLEIAKKSNQMTWSASGKKYPLNTFDPHNVYGRRKPGEPPVQRDVCIGLLFGLTPTCADKDVDNMTKLFLDALKGPEGLIHDDDAIVHLDVIKRVLLPSSAIENNYVVGVRISLVSLQVKREVSFTWQEDVPLIDF